MKLWIRSQDKENLIKIINQIGLYYSNKKMIIANYQPDFIGTQGEYYEKLGVYKSKERALEVLDEIQRIMHPTVFMSGEISTDDNKCVENGIIYQKCKDNFSIQELSTYVYEMPKD